MVRSRVILFLIFLLHGVLCHAEDTLKIYSVEPPFWWAGMEYNNLQLLVYGQNIGNTNVSSSSPDIQIKEIHRPENKNYLFIDIEIFPEAAPGVYKIEFLNDINETTSIQYSLKVRAENAGKQKGFKSTDVIYLLMPDRFSNGNPENDNHKDMLESADRSNPNGRHGGDIEGIANHLDYIADMGFTAIWINPLLENNMPAYSYHGYAITDFYRIDPRFGSNHDYKLLVDSAHSKGLKVIMDMVFNHCGTGNPLIEDLPVPDWVNMWDNFTRTSYRGDIISDPYVSDYDLEIMEKGWFSFGMADLNQNNPFVYNYLLQNCIWWIEYSGIDGIRMDTYPFPEKESMAKWAKTILELYPRFSIVGEVWLREPAQTAYWQEGNRFGYDSFLPVVTDFPLYYAMSEAFVEKESWQDGITKLHNILSQDFLYSNPDNLLVFADNHDLSRFFTTINEDLSLFKMAMTFLLTTRGIPEIYYGTEILMTGEEHSGHGYIRQDFPGGWRTDTINAFVAKGLSPDQLEAQLFLKKLLNWRASSEVIHSGHLKHYLPADGIYVYFRYNDDKSVMVAINKNSEEVQLETARFKENLTEYNSAVEIISGSAISDLDNIRLPSRSAIVLELNKD
ncbi:MAG: glycoside hydrolase family 13 protein [Bacteroidales bacterium]|nr:glycoside hydrolase family 13 protein [Bacteroidales bacterium]